MKIEVLVGMIASGKSTYALKRADEGALVVCHDDLTAMLHGRYRFEQGLRDLYREMEQVVVSVAIFHGKDVVLDRTHLTRESRSRWIKEAGIIGSAIKQKVDVYAVTFPVEFPFIHALRRVALDSRGRPYEQWLKVAAHHYEQAMAEPLTPDEGFDAIYPGQQEDH